MIPWQEKDYRELLKLEWEKRHARNPKYSLRSFARDLDMAPSRLSDVLKGRYGLSRQAAIQVAEKLGFSDEKKRYFTDAVESRHGRSLLTREKARSRLDEQPYSELTAEAFAAISNWYHFAILELTKLDNFQSDIDWIAGKLGISDSLVQSAIDRLIRLGQLTRKANGELQATTTSTTTTDGVPSEAIREFHKQILEKAIIALDRDPLSTRSSTAMVTAVNEEDIVHAKAFIKSFRRAFDKRFGEADRKTAVYCLSMQFFNVGDPKSKN